MSRKKELIFNTIIIGIGKFGTQVLSIFLLPLYTSVLSTREYGIYDFVWTISIFLIPIITLLMEESMFRFLIDAKTDEEKDEIISQVVRYIIKRLLIYTILILFIGVIISKVDIYIALLYIISGVLMTSINAILRGFGKIKVYSALNFLNSVTVIILNIIFILKLRLGYKSLLYSAIIVNFLCVIFITFKFKIYKSLKFNDKRKLKEMKKYSLPLVPNSISWATINTSDRLILTSFMGPSANGVYAMANKFPTVMDNIYGFFYTAWKESAAKALKDDDSSTFYNNIYDMLKGILFSIVIGMCACMPFVFNFLIKNEFKDAYIYIPVLLISMFYSNMSGFYGGIFSAYKDTKIMGYTTLISAIINLIINIICIRFIGIWAAVGSTLIATFTVYIIRKNRIKNKITLSYDSITLTILKVLIALIVMYSYYSKKIAVNILTLIIVLIFCVILNRKTISLFLNFTKKKLNK